MFFFLMISIIILWGIVNVVNCLIYVYVKYDLIEVRIFLYWKKIYDWLVIVIYIVVVCNNFLRDNWYLFIFCLC